MINVYKESDYEEAYKLKKKLLVAYFIVLGLGIAACATLFVLFLRLPYLSSPTLRSQRNLYLFIICVISGVEVVFSYIYLGIPYKRARSRFFLLDDVKNGKKELNEGTFLQNEEYVTEVGNVDYRVMVVLEWSEKTQEYMRRNVLVDKEKPLPNLKTSDIIVYTTYSNVLLSYGLKSEEEAFDI